MNIELDYIVGETIKRIKGAAERMTLNEKM